MSNQTQLAVVGFGLIGRRHADVIRRTPGMTLSAVVEPNPDGQEVARAFGAKVYTSLEDMLSEARLTGWFLRHQHRCTWSRD